MSESAIKLFSRFTYRISPNSLKSKSNENSRSFERRDFLKLGATGVVASIAGCTPSVISDPAPVPTPGSGNGQREVGGTQDVPEIGNLIDPEFIPAENWLEPWTWRPELWPDASLDLNVVRNQNPGASPSPGNPAPAIFSYNGGSPGPTIRVRNNGVLKIRVRNTLGLNDQVTQVGPAPDPIDVPPEVANQICGLIEEQIRAGIPQNSNFCVPFFFPEQVLQIIQPETRLGWELKGHINGQHAAHVTNLHTHGLHVFPQTNQDGSHSDNVFIRILPQEDWKARLASKDENLHTLAEYEHVGHLDYKLQFQFERNGELMDHPPGTHWYHPHSHGATNDQVASGMAGFLIVEGDVDASINLAMTGERYPDPEAKTGPYDYRERLIFIQRVFVQSFDLDAGSRRNNLRFPPLNAVNGAQSPTVFRMRPGAVERWRVLNGSVDGAGTKRFMVLDGQFVQRQNKIWRVIATGDRDNRERRLEAVSEQELEDAKLELHQLSFDGITLVTEENGQAVHKIRDLSKLNAGTQNPFATPAEEGENENLAQLRAYESCFRNGDSVRRTFVRPNEVYLTNANRTDVLFKAPVNSKGKVFTIFAKEAHVHTDTHQHRLQRRREDGRFVGRRPLFDVIAAYIHVDGEPVDDGDFDIQSLNASLPPVPPLLLPIQADELAVPASEAAVTGVRTGSKRTRSIGYSGIGGADFPLIHTPDGFAERHPELENLVWGTHEDTQVLLANWTRTMAINTEFDLMKNPEPGPPHKFAPHDEKRSRVLVDTAEEWVLYNNSMTLWSHTDRDRFPQPGSYSTHFESFPITRAEGQRRNAEDPEFKISTKGIDHPFHIHINPIWVLRIDVPDENGDLHNILPAPIWMDTVAIPRNGGRVVFRTRFDDFVGTWVHHCHILSHEDMGMMQAMECTDNPSQVNYNPRSKAAEHGMPGREVDAIYPKPSLETMYRQNMCFVDPNEIGYQVYPGFDVEIPKLDA